MFVGPEPKFGWNASASSPESSQPWHFAEMSSSSSLSAFTAAALLGKEYTRPSRSHATIRRAFAACPGSSVMPSVFTSVTFGNAGTADHEPEKVGADVGSTPLW